MGVEAISEKRRKPHETVEAVFDIFYLLAVLFCGGYFLHCDEIHPVLPVYGCMLLVLVGGDSFHLVPRIVVICTGNKKSWGKALGIGKMITSITMTGMYVLLFVVHTILYPSENIRLYDKYVFIVLVVLAVIRIALCLLPQNQWTKEGGGSLKWAILRNLPFVLIGGIAISLYSLTGFAYDDGFRYMSIAVFLSFLFYIPVVLGSRKYSFLGALMLPKTLMYLWIAAMGFSVVIK